MSLRDTAVSNFFSAIQSGKIHAGTTLSQSEIAKILGVSLSPLREALKLLEFQGFVRILPRSGVEICQSDMQLIKDCFQLRRILEAAGIRRFVEFEQPEALKTLLAKHKALIEDINEKKPRTEIQEKLTKLDHELHLTLMSSLKNDIIMRDFRTNQDRIMLFRLDSISLTYHGLKCTCEEHIAILEAALEGSPDDAAAALDQHLLETMHRAMAI